MTRVGCWWQGEKPCRLHFVKEGLEKIGTILLGVGKSMFQGFFCRCCASSANNVLISWGQGVMSIAIEREAHRFA